MAKHELYTELDGGIAYSGEAKLGKVDGDGAGAAVDLKGFGSTLVLFICGATGDTLSGSDKLEPIIDVSDTDGSYAAAPAADLKGDDYSVIDANTKDQKVVAVSYIGPKRWLKPRFEFTGTHTNGIPVAIVVLRGHAAKI
jgi:hypothetical protein